MLLFLVSSKEIRHKKTPGDLSSVLCLTVNTVTSHTQLLHYSSQHILLPITMDFSGAIEKFDGQFSDEKYSRIMITLQVVSHNLITNVTFNLMRSSE